MENECYGTQFGCEYKGDELQEIAIDQDTFLLCPACERRVVRGVSIVNGIAVVIIRHRTKEVAIMPGFTEKKGFTGKFVCFPDDHSIKLEMLGGWFQHEPEIIKCELTFDSNAYRVTTVITRANDENKKRTLASIDEHLSCLRPEIRLPEGTKILSREDGRVYTIHDSTETNNQFGYGVYRYRVKERLDTGFALHRKWFNVLSDYTER